MLLSLTPTSTRAFPGMDPRSRGLSYIAAGQVWPLSSPGFLSHCNESIRPLRLTLNSICLWLFWAGGVNLQNIWSCLVPTSIKFRGGDLRTVPQSPALHICLLSHVECTSAVLSSELTGLLLGAASHAPSALGLKDNAQEFPHKSLAELKRRNWM